MQGMRNTIILSCVALLTVAAVTAPAQVLYGSLVGNVKDASGASVPGAVITVTSKETGNSRTTTTNDEGGYNIPTIQSGTYTVKVTKEGFRSAEQTDVAVTINTVTRTDFTMDIGAVTESV